jgi:hypothetical protein
MLRNIQYSFLRILFSFSIIVYCRFQCEGQGKKQTFECQKYHLLQAHLDRWDADNHRIKLIIDKSSSIKTLKGLRLMLTLTME